VNAKFPVPDGDAFYEVTTDNRTAAYELVYRLELHDPELGRSIADVRDQLATALAALMTASTFTGAVMVDADGGDQATYEVEHWTVW
jgi:hypothetical protein